MTSGNIACMIMEPIQGVGGFITLPPAYMEGAAEIVRSKGGLIIIDEVQTGFGRTGLLVGASTCQHQTGHHDDGQRDRQRNAAFGRGHNSRNCGRCCRQGANLEHIWWKPGSCAAAMGTLEEMKREFNPERSAEMGDILRTG